MSTFDTLARPARRDSDWAINKRKSLNNNMLLALLIFLALAPLPFGGVYALSWSASALFVGIAVVIYMLRLSSIGISLPIGLGQIGLPTLLFFIYSGYLIVQLLPIGALLPGLTQFMANGMTFQSNTLSVAADQTALMFMRQMTYGLLFFLIVQVTQNPERLQFFFKAVVVIIALYCAQAVISLQSGDTVLGVTKHFYLGSATGTFVNRNSFATLLAMGAVAALAQVGNHVVRQFERHQHDGLVPGAMGNVIIYGSLYLVLLGVVFATNSRMGVFCALTGSAVILTIVIARLSRSLTAIVMMLAAVVLGLVAGIFFFGEALLDRSIDLDASSAGRLDLYWQTLKLIAMRPLTGYGGGAFEQAYQIVHQPPVSPDFVWNRAHNSYLSLWSEMGLFFGSLPVIALLLVGVRLIRALRKNSYAWVAQATGLAVLVIGAVHSLVDFSLEIQANAMFFVAIVGAAVGSTYSGKTSLS